MNAGNPYLLALVGLLGTLLGAGLSGLIQFASLKRQLKSARVGAELDRLSSLEVWARSSIEARYQDIWRERRQLYAASLHAADDWYEAIRDLASATTRWKASPETGPVSESGGHWTRHSAEMASPEVAAHFTRHDAFVRQLREIEILGHESVVEVARNLHLTMIQAAKGALEGEPSTEVPPMLAAQCRQMRTVLTEPHIPKELDYEPSRRASQPRRTEDRHQDVHTTQPAHAPGVP